MALTTFPASGTANFETVARNTLEEWRQAIDTKAVATHTHDAGSPAFISIVANEAGLGAGAQDGQLVICKSNGNRYVWDDTNSKWRICSGNIYTANPSTSSYQIETGTIVTIATGGTEVQKRWNGSSFDTLPELDQTATWTKGQRGQITTITANATLDWDLADSNHFIVTLSTSNHVLNNPNNIVAGQSGYIVAIASGGYNISGYGSYIKHKDGSAPSLTTTGNAKNLFAYFVESSTVVHLRYLGVSS